MRRFVADVLEGSPFLGDAVLCVSELAANASVHSKSGLPGGQFEVRVFLHPAGHVRVEVTDQGGPWNPDPGGRQNHGRGLLIISHLATDWGIVGDDHAGRTAWFELLSAPDRVSDVSAGQIAAGCRPLIVADDRTALATRIHEQETVRQAGASNLRQAW